ncbi:MAG: hypothetical protein AMJ61_06700 [Desulfobacterales bacterium SG8_35_2]|jgi:hypothetical protein|nr:MAG: hypothetical protein AMJ61_06700 [Desulfobacterales bacterium SG8_35_2]
MIKDYSDSFILANSRNKIKTSRKKSSAASTDLFSASKLMWKTVGAMLLVTVIIGISSTIWYGLQVQVALDQIGSNMDINTALHKKKKLLIVQRDLMLTQNQMEAAAQKIGLQSPEEKQIRYP